MKKWLLTAIAVLCIGTCAVGFAACGESGDTEPEHHFSEAWTWDSTNHWHACTDEGCTQRSGTAPHIYGEDDECDICHYTRPPVHEHTWTAKYDESKHWQESTCTDHEPVIEGEAQHSYNNAGECTCGVKQSEAQVYAVYKSFTESKDETVLDFPAWLAYLEENDIESVSLNSAGDGVLHHADNTEEVAYFRTRTIKVQATNAGSPFISYWVKITVTHGAETTVLDLQKPQTDELDVTLTFTPVGYSDADLVYHIAIADENDDLPQGEVPYHEDYVVFGDSSVEYDFTEYMTETEYAAEFAFREALSLTHSVVITDPGASTSGGVYSETPFKGLTAGTYKLTFSDASDNLVIDGKFRISVVASTRIADDQLLYNDYLQKFNVSADGRSAYTYLHLPQSQLNGNVTLRMATMNGRVSFTMSLERFEPVIEAADSDPIEVATLPHRLLVSFSEHQCGIDISNLEAGVYFASIATCTGGYSLVSPLPTKVSAAIDNELPIASSRGYGSHVFYLDIPEGAHYLYLYDNDTTQSNGSTNIGMFTIRKVKELDDEAVSFVNGEAYYKVPLEEDAENYLVSLTSSGNNLGGLSVSQATRNYAFAGSPSEKPGCTWDETPIITSKSGAYNHVSALTSLTKGDKDAAAENCAYLYLAGGADITDLHLSVEAYNATSAGDLSKENTALTFSASKLAATYTFTPAAAGSFLFAVQSESDISGITILKDGAQYIAPSANPANGIFRMIECEDTTPVTFTFLHSGADYPTVNITVSAPNEVSGGKTLADNETDNITLSGQTSVMVYSFTPTAEGLHILDIVGENANAVTVYKGTTTIISPSNTASAFVSYFDTALTSETPYTYVVLYDGSDELELTVTMHSAKDADALKADEDTTPSLGATAHVKYYTYTPSAKGDYRLEIIGESVKDYAVYDVATGKAIITKVADNVKFANGLWFTQSDESYAAKSIAVICYGDAAESVTLKLHTAGGAEAENAGTAFDVEYTAEATSWHVKYVNITATAGTYLFTVAASGEAKLANLSIYVDGNSAALKTFSASNVAVAYAAELTVGAEGSVTLVFIYGGADARTVSVDLIAKSAETTTLNLAPAGQPAAETAFGTDPASRVKFFTFTPENAGNYQVEFSTTENATLKRLGVYVYEGDATAATFKAEAVTENTNLTQTFASSGFAFKADTKYTICVVWTGEGALEGKAGIAMYLAIPDAKEDANSTYDFGRGYIVWNAVEGATNYIVQKPNGDVAKTYDAVAGTGIYDRFVYEATENGSHKVIAQYKSGDAVMVQSEKTVSVSALPQAKITLNITTPADWEEHSITVQFTGYGGIDMGYHTLNAGASSKRVLTLPAGAHEYTMTFYPKNGYTTKSYAYKIDVTSAAIEGWGCVFSGQTAEVSLSSNTSYTTNLNLAHAATFTVTVKAPQGYVNSNVKVALMNASETVASGTAVFTGESEGEQSQAVVLSAFQGEYTIAVDFGNGMDKIEEENPTIKTEGDARTAAATVSLRKYVEHKVTLDLPEGYDGGTEFTVGLFLSDTATEDLKTENALLTKKVTPEKSATTAEVTFEATWGNTYIAAVTEGLIDKYGAEQYEVTPSEEMTAESGDATASATITVGGKPKLIITLLYEEVVTSGSVLLWISPSPVFQLTETLAPGTTQTVIEVHRYPAENAYVLVQACTIDGETTYNTGVSTVVRWTLTEGQTEVAVTLTLTKKST